MNLATLAVVDRVGRILLDNAALNLIEPLTRSIRPPFFELAVLVVHATSGVKGVLSEMFELAQITEMPKWFAYSELMRSDLSEGTELQVCRPEGHSIR